MKSTMRLLIVTLCVAAILAALPSTAQAGKNLFKARLSTDAELHEVVGSTARGNFTLATTPSGYQFFLNVNGLSGPVTGAHIHGPAGEDAGLRRTTALVW